MPKPVGVRSVHARPYSMAVPAGFPHATFGDCQTHFGRTFGATVLALRAGNGLVVGPAWAQPVSAGDTLYYVAGERIDAGRLGART